jgi:hypothetical protein
MVCGETGSTVKGLVAVVSTGFVEIGDGFAFTTAIGEGFEADCGTLKFDYAFYLL